MSAAHWREAALLAYYLAICLLYGFGTLIVAFNTSRELDGHAAAVDALRVHHAATCFLAWGPAHGGFAERAVVKDVCHQVKDVRRAAPRLRVCWFGAARS